jgi:hypothetical protein
MQVPDISIDLNSDTFVPADGQELGARLRAETDLLVQSEVVGYAIVEGGPPPPDVVIYIIYTLAPLAKDIYVNLLSSALWDTVKGAFERQGKADSEATFSVLKVDEEGRILREVTGRTSDPEIIKDLIRQASEEDEA